MTSKSKNLATEFTEHTESVVIQAVFASFRRAAKCLLTPFLCDLCVLCG